MTYGFISIEYPDCDRIEDIAENLCANVKGRPCILQTVHKGVLVQAGPSDTPSKIVEKFHRAAKRRGGSSNRAVA